MSERQDPEDDIVTLLHRTEVQVPILSFRLIVIEGPDVGTTLVLDGVQPQPILIGQSVTCTVRLTDRTVSRRHVALEVQGIGVRITDLDSKNGTFVNDVRITEALLGGGELVRLGATTFRVDPEAPQQGAVLSNATSFGRVVGASVEMRRLYPLCERLATSDVALVIEGETGTGKELLAEAIHAAGPRASAPFVVFDVTAIPANLMEAELFGHERGAFTGAVSPRKGMLEFAHGGTLLIDEIGDLELTLQPKLLRVLERGEVRPIGSNRTISVDVRIMASTRRDLDREVAAGRFRDDLFHRLAVARIELPPLRRRKGDIQLLARYFWRQMGGKDDDLGPEILSRWDESSWPGNVRELRNNVARLMALGDLRHVLDAKLPVPRDADQLELDELAAHFARAMSLPFTEARRAVMDEFDKRYVDRRLEAHDGNITRAAKSAGVARRYFQLVKTRSQASSRG